MRPVPSMGPREVAAVRAGLSLSQRVFAQVLNVSPETVRGWEQGKRTPDGASLRLLELARAYPDWVLERIRDRDSSAGGRRPAINRRGAS